MTAINAPALHGPRKWGYDLDQSRRHAVVAGKSTGAEHSASSLATRLTRVRLPTNPSLWAGVHWAS